MLKVGRQQKLTCILIAVCIALNVGLLMYAMNRSDFYNCTKLQSEASQRSYLYVTPSTRAKCLAYGITIVAGSALTH